MRSIVLLLSVHFISAAVVKPRGEFQDKKSTKSPYLDDKNPFYELASHLTSYPRQGQHGKEFHQRSALSFKRNKYDRYNDKYNRYDKYDRHDKKNDDKFDTNENEVIDQHKEDHLEVVTDHQEEHRPSKDFHCDADLLCDASSMEYRTFDGSCNNLKHSFWGQAGTPYKRLVPRKQSVVDCGNPSFVGLPNSRLVSRLLTKRGEFDKDHKLTHMVMCFGQAVDHDILLTPLRQTENGSFLDCCKQPNKFHKDCCPIDVPQGDFFYGTKPEIPMCIPFIRSKTQSHRGKFCNKLSDVGSENTAWLDLSFIYGSNDELALDLRDTSEGKGKLKTTLDDKGRHFPAMKTDDQGNQKMYFGDKRGDVHPVFTVLTTIFIRNHNRIASDLSKKFPSWTDETIYQEARKFNIAIYQNIVYTQFLDALLGENNGVSNSHSNHLFEDVYDETVDGTVSMVFSTAAFRLHSFVSGHIQLRDHHYKLKESMKLREVFHKPDKIVEHDNFDDIIRGQAAQPLQEFNPVFSEDITEHLFTRGHFGLDIVSLNVQRGRDHQIQGYTTYKNLCGLGSTHGWGDLTDLISTEFVHRLAHTYENPDDVDMYIALAMEKASSNSLLGPTTICLIKHQFEVLKHGDRFFYSIPGHFSSNQMRKIRQQTLSSVMCANADNPETMTLQPNMFKKADDHGHDHGNGLRPCSHYPVFSI